MKVQNEKVNFSPDRAERLGWRFNYDSGFLVVTPPRSQDSEETEASVIELGTCMKELLSTAAGRARAARARDLVGQQIFIPSAEIVGTLQACEADGVLTVSYMLNERSPNYTAPGDEVFFIVDGGAADERSLIASTVVDDRLRALVERAESVGIRFAWDSGLLLAQWSEMGADERSAGERILREIGKSFFPHLKLAAVARARALRGRSLIGARVFVPEFMAFGSMQGCDGDDGAPVVSYQDGHLGSRLTCRCSGDAVMIIDGATNEPALAVDKPEARWRGFLRRTILG